MIVGSISHSQERRCTVTKDILALSHSHQWTKPCIAQCETIHCRSRKKEETELSAGYDRWWNAPMLSSNGNSTLDMFWSRPWHEQACKTSSHVSITISHNSEPFIDGHLKSGSSRNPESNRSE